MSESEPGLSPARSQPLRAQTRPGSRERRSPAPAGAPSPRGGSGAGTPELPGCLWDPASPASRVPRSGRLRDALSPGTAPDRGNRRPSTAGGRRAGLPGSLSQRGGCPFSFSLSQKETPLAKRMVRDLCESESRCSPGRLGEPAQGLPACGPRPLTSGKERGGFLLSPARPGSLVSGARCLGLGKPACGAPGRKPKQLRRAQGSRGARLAQPDPP